MSRLDKFDVAILERLQQRGRMSNQELAEAVHLTPSPCLRRVKQLEDDGYIQGYVALLNARRLGLSLMSFIHISLEKHTPAIFEAFELAINQWPEVLECHLIAGQSADYLIKVIVQDMEAYQHFLLQKLTPIKGVSGVHSSFVLKSPIQNTALPILI